MSSMIFCTSFFDTEEGFVSRYLKWFNHYKSIDNDSYFFFIDDASPICQRGNDDWNEYSKKYPINFNTDEIHLDKINFYTFDLHLGRPLEFYCPGWWRSFAFSVEIAEKFNFEKIIHAESDFYILKKSMIDDLKNLKHHWYGLWCERYKMPETSCQIICKERFKTLKKLKNIYDILTDIYDLKNITKEQILEYEDPTPFVIEHFIPFNKILKNYTGDRYGEENLEITKDMDFYGQLAMHRKIINT